MQISISLNVPQIAIDTILAKAKELGCYNPKNEKLLVIDIITEVVKNNIYGYHEKKQRFDLPYAHMKVFWEELIDFWFEHYSDNFENLLKNQKQ